jgi:hypothetical protein
VALLPQLTPATELGTAGVAGYAAREGISPEAYARRFEPILTPPQVAQAVLELAGDPASAPEFLVSGAGYRAI